MNAIFWHITLYSPLKFNRYFGGTYCLKTLPLLATCLHTDCLFGFLDLEDGGDILLRKVN
jgi:hypothetical protein